jgi:hypothetical protein
MLTAKAGLIATMLVLFALHMLVFALLAIVEGDNVRAIGDVLAGLIALYFLPRRI